MRINQLRTLLANTSRRWRAFDDIDHYQSIHIVLLLPLSLRPFHFGHLYLIWCHSHSLPLASFNRIDHKHKLCFYSLWWPSSFLPHDNQTKRAKAWENWQNLIIIMIIIIINIMMIMMIKNISPNHDKLWMAVSFCNTLVRHWFRVLTGKTGQYNTTNKY